MLTLEQARKRYLPMSETMFYILLSLKQERHGYGIMQHVKELTDARIVLGAGTIYSSRSCERRRPAENICHHAAGTRHPAGRGVAHHGTAP